MRHLTAFALSAVLALTGCGSDRPAGPSGNETLITYTRSGGFAPTLERLTMDVDGDGTGRSGFGASGRKIRSFTLAPGKLEELRDAIEAARLDEVEAGDYVCADCFEYEIKTPDAEVSLSNVDFDEGSEAVIPPEVDELYDLLGELAGR